LDLLERLKFCVFFRFPDEVPHGMGAARTSFLVIDLKGKQVLKQLWKPEKPVVGQGTGKTRHARTNPFSLLRVICGAAGFAARSFEGGLEDKRNGVPQKRKSGPPAAAPGHSHGHLSARCIPQEGERERHPKNLKSGWRKNKKQKLIAAI